MAGREYTFAVVGATGAVGREMVSVLEQRKLPIKELRLLASERSLGTSLRFEGKEIDVQKLGPDSFEGINIALFSAGGAISKEFGPIAAQAGTVVIDNSSTFRMNEDVPLIVPEVNTNALRDAIKKHPQGKGFIIANPNCSTIQLVVVLKPILDKAGIKRIVVSTYQAASGAGKKAMTELFEQTRALLTSGEPEVKHLPKRIAFNCIPHIDVFLDNAYTKEEWKVRNETRKILGMPNLRVTCTAVRVPVFNCHAESVNIELEKPLAPEEARALLQESPGVIVTDSPNDKQYPLQMDITGTDATYVGRIREDETVPHGLNMWIVADNLRKGAALNAVQIAEVLINEWA